jgi:riboflavin kinase
VPAAARPRRLKFEEVELLKRLALAGGDRTPVVLSSREVGGQLGVSQQAADQYLVALEGRGLLSRALGARKQRLSLTPAGMTLLRREYQGYRRIFEGPGRMRFRGSVASGLGEGRYYLSQPGYLVQFTERLGYTPYPGTLNVKVEPEDFRRVEAAREWRAIRIDGFAAGGRTFGGASCFAARLNGRACHLIVPDRTHHRDVVELISPEYLRETLGLKDDDRVELEVEES